MQTAGIQYLLEAITKIKRWKKTSSYLGLAAYHRYSDMKEYLEDGIRDWKRKIGRLHVCYLNLMPRTESSRRYLVKREKFFKESFL